MVPTPEDWLWPLLRAALVLSASALLMGGVVWLLKPLSPRVQRLAWFLVLAQGVVFLQLPVQIAWYEHPSTTGPVNLNGPAEVVVPPQTTVKGTVDASGERVLRLLALQQPEGASPRQIAGTREGSVGPAAKFSRTESFSWSWPQAVLAVWLIGLIAVPIRSVIGYTRMLRQLGKSEPAREAWSQEWQGLLAAYKPARSIRLHVTREMGPCLCWSPAGYRIVVPHESWQQLDPEQRVAILHHELEHYRRGDTWSAALSRLLAWPQWFNPFAWWAVRRTDECAEWACDEAATRDAQMTANSYARALMRLGGANVPLEPYATGARGGRVV